MRCAAASGRRTSWTDGLIMQSYWRFSPTSASGRSWLDEEGAIMTSQDWIDKADKYIMKTYGRYPLVPVRGEGCRVWDADGKEYLDFLAGVAVNNLGHCHPRVVEALRKQAGELIHCSNYYQIPQQIELAEILCTHSFA